MQLFHFKWAENHPVQDSAKMEWQFFEGPLLLIVNYIVLTAIICYLNLAYSLHL